MPQHVTKPNTIIRQAQERDIPGITAIYDAILNEQELGRRSVGWQRGVYPTVRTARAALRAGDLYVMEAEGRIVASAASTGRKTVTPIFNGSTRPGKMR